MYIQEEKALPGQELVPFEKPLVDAVEALIRFHRQKGGGTVIQTESQWEVVIKVFEVWATLYPQEYINFKNSQGKARSNQKNHNASNREKGGAEIQHMINMPQVFHSILRVLYPNQRFDKKFVTKLGNRMPLLRMPEKL